MANMPEDAPVEYGVADAMTPAPARVRSRRRESPGVWTLEIGLLQPVMATAEPGQFNMLTAFGVGEVPISLSGDQRSPSTLVHTTRSVGPVSAALTRLRPGEPLGVRGPFGAGWPMDQAKGRDVVIMAGGLGLAPLRPVLQRLLAEREHYGQILLLYGTRSPADILYRRELQSWRRRLDLDIEVTVDHAVGDWRGHVGVVTTLLDRATFDATKSVAFVCGPEVMMRFCIGALTDAGVAPGSIYLSMERNMKCAIGQCGHCQLGPVFICRDGPVFAYPRIAHLMNRKEL